MGQSRPSCERLSEITRVHRELNDKLEDGQRRRASGEHGLDLSAELEEWAKTQKALSMNDT